MPLTLGPFILSVGLLILPPWSLQAEVFDFEGKAQGTTYRIVYRAQNEIAGLQTKLESKLKDFDKIFSNYSPNSDIERFNAYPATDWFAVSLELVKLVELATSVSYDSKGAFDITVGSLMKIWGFGPYKKLQQTSPDEGAIKAAKKLVNFRSLSTRQSPPSIKKSNPHIIVDLSGIAQGYSVDTLAVALEAQSMHDYLVEIGGEIRTKGERAQGKPWLVGIESPSMEPDQQGTQVFLSNQALTTAGDYREFREEKGKRLSHTIDPRTGHPVAHTLASATVVAPTAVLADAWDTACMVLGEIECSKRIVKKNLQAFLISRSKNGFDSQSVNGFDSLLVKSPSKK